MGQEKPLFLSETVLYILYCVILKGDTFIMIKRKIVALLLAGVMCVALTACKDDTTGTENQTQTQPVEKTAGVGIVKLGEYKGLTIEASKYVPSDAEVDETARYFFSQAAREFEWNKETAELGDTVVIDYVGSVDGVAFEGGTAENTTLELGSGSYIDGFEDGLVGIKEGEERVLDLTFPENYHNADLAGKLSQFDVTCHKIIPPMTDENVATIQSAEYSNIEELKAFAKKTIEQFYNEDYETNIITNVLDQVMNTTLWGELPQDMMEEQREYVISQYQPAADEQGVDIESYFAQYNTSVDTFAATFVKQNMLFDAIAENEGLVATDKDIEEAVQKMIDEVYQDGRTIEDFFADNDREEYRRYCTIQKVYEFILENTNVVDSTAQ